MYAQSNIVTVQSVTCQPCGPLRKRLRDVLGHHRGEVAGGLVDVHRHRADVHVEPERDAGAGRRRVHPQPERGGEQVARRAQQPGGLARADRFGQYLGQPGPGAGVGLPPRREARRAGAEPGGATHRDHGRRQPGRDRPQHTLLPRPTPVDLVHEQQRRDAQPLQRPHQDTGLRLHPLDGRDHQDGPVQDAQHPFHFGDEVGVAGGVDQVDGDAADGERHHSGLDRDPALALERERIGLRRARVDAADLADDTGGEEQPLGERGLTGVDVRQDAQVERLSRQASYPSRSRKPS
jgi:hypothetical protein